MSWWTPTSFSALSSPTIRILLKPPERLRLWCAGTIQFFFSPQNIAEFWNVATRPVERNGLGLSPDRTFQEIAGIEKSLFLLPDVPEIYVSWKEIVRANKVLGVKVHDARLVAIMTVYSVSGLLTFNAADFARFTNITAIHPSSLVP